MFKIEKLAVCLRKIGEKIMFNFLTSNSDTIILKSFSVNPDDDTILNIQGERIGLFKWILSK